MKQKIITETPISIAEVKQTLDSIKEKEGELNYRAGKTFEYLEQFSRIDAKQAKKLSDALVALEIPRLRDNHIAKLVDIRPMKGKEVKTVLQGYAVTITNDNLDKIAKAIQEHGNV